MRANVIAVVFAAALVLSINAADNHTHPADHHHDSSHTHTNGTAHHLGTCHASHISHAEATHIIKKINDLRNSVAEGHLFHGVTASNMKAIHWDAHLAESAREFAGHCRKNNSHHDTRHSAHGHHSTHPIKEITFVATSKCEHFKHALIDKAFEIWEHGKSHLSHVHINHYSAEHNEERILSQLIWAETGHIGCGYSNSEIHHPHHEYKQVIVCQFQSAGNQKGHPVFQVGKSCAHCPHGFECDPHGAHKHLCINKTDSHHLDPKHFNFTIPHDTHHHPNQTTHTNIKNCSANKLDDGVKTSFVDALNAERERIASGKATPLPSSGNMNQLQWNPSLEASALKWAQQCIHAMDVKHVHHLQVSEIVFGMSANSSFSKFNDKAALNAFFRGHDQLNASLVNKFHLGSKEANIYAQIAWAKSTQVGCAYANLIEAIPNHGNIHAHDQFIQVVVCHFTEQGDHPGQPIYEVGQNCQHCKTGKCSDKYPHLCPI